MSKQNEAAQGSAAAAGGKKFRDMNGSERMRYVGKVCVFLLTAGFAYPHILQE